MRGKRILLTGASSGIGAVAARKLAAEGASIVVVARRENLLAEVVDRITAAGGNAAAIAADLADLADVDRVVLEVGAVDIVINNAARSIRRPLLESLERADRPRPGSALALMIRPLLSAMLVASLVLTGCQGIEPTADAAPYPTGPVTMTAGANPGSGFDLTIRAVAEALQKERIVNVRLPVQNRPGGSGADFLATMVEQYRGAEDQVSVTSLSMMVNQRSGVSTYGYGDVTMIARLMTEYFVVVTRPGSAFKNLGDVMAAIKSEPARVAVGAAHDDEAPFDLLVSAAGGDPSAVHYVTHEGGGDQSAALLDGDIDVAIGGVSEFIGQLKSKELAPLGVLAENRLPGLDVPTAREQGLDVTLANWRGLYGPPDMPQAAVDYWQQAVAQMVGSPTWTQIAERSQFTTTFLMGDEFQAFLAKTQADVDAALEGAGQ